MPALIRAAIGGILALAALASLAVADDDAPAADDAPLLTLDLATVINRTVCPIKVEIDEDPDRIPKRIKLIRCASDPHQWCTLMNIPKNECCQHQHDNLRLECVEVQDTVQVYYPQREVSQPYRVSVGCTCYMGETPRAPDAAPSPGRI